ncbi:MAG TPA: Ldh family oxidoreductase [Solirubrobacterales bacterium]
MPALSARRLQAFATEMLVAMGAPGPQATAIARGLTAANLRGLDSHGVLRLIQYSQSLASGEVLASPTVTVSRVGPGAAIVDAGGGYGYLPATRAARLAAGMAGTGGAAVVGVRNSHHFGMAAQYVERIAAAGKIGIVLSNASPILATEGMRRAAVGNNPVAFAFPRRPPRDPIVLDMALSTSAFGRVRLAAAEGREIPLGWALDEEGRPTTDAARALAAELLVPVGGYKGFGLALVVDLLAAALTGSPSGSRAGAHRNPAGGVGHLVVAIAPSLFVPEEQFLDAVEELAADLAAASAENGDVAVLPGDPERRTAEARTAEGVPISSELAARLVALARELGVEPPEELAAA